MISRRGFLRWLGGLLAAGAATGAYAGYVEPVLRLRETRWRLTPPGWPEGAPLRIVALADIHMGPPQMTPARLARIVARVNALGGDVIVLLGDYIATHRFVTRAVPAPEVAGVLAGLRAPLGVWSVMGNHDWWNDKDAQAARSGPTLWHRAFEAAGLPVLENRAVRLDHGPKGVWLAGLGDQWAFHDSPWEGVDDLDAALAPCADEAPVILLAHEPDIFTRVPDRVSLTLSGHTHGGQVRLFGWAPMVPSRYGDRYGYGHVVEDGRHLVVSSGLGCSVAPVRLGAPPEIMIVELDGA